MARHDWQIKTAEPAYQGMRDAMSSSFFIRGFGISNFRSFPTEPVRFGPFEKINVIIGPNNSGKSNVLRYVRKRYSQILSRTNSKDLAHDAVDRPRKSDGDLSYDLILFIADDKVMRDKFKGQADAINTLLEHSKWEDPSINKGYWLPFKKTGNDRSIDVTGFPEETREFNRVIMPAWQNLMGSSGGSYQTNWLPDLLQLVGRVVPRAPSNIVNIPASRQILSHLKEYQDDYKHDPTNADPIIHELAMISQPAPEEQEKKLSFRKIVAFLREVLNEPELELEIPYNRDTITVHLHGKSLPIEALGTGIHELVILASKAVLAEKSIVCIEEPELHFHPELQRQFMKFIYNETDNQYFITTHSAHVMDAVPCSVHRVYLEDGISKATRPITGGDRREICHELGYKPSDLLQSNCVIWVEGPSDRIYLKHWIDAKAAELTEGLHYSIMFYGGALRSHLSAQEETIEDFIQLLPINRFPVMVMDSDKDSLRKRINASKERIKDELNENRGLCWVTKGREIENYISRQLMEDAVKHVHKDVVRLTATDPTFGKPLNFLRKGQVNDVEKGFDKVAIARRVCEKPADFSILDLEDRVDELITFIRRANRIELVV